MPPRRATLGFLALVVLTFLVRPSEGAPSGYRCGQNGKAIAGVGCQCGQGEAPAEDAKGTAICVPAPKPARSTIVTLDSNDILAREQVAPVTFVKHVLISWKDLAPAYPRLSKAKVRARLSSGPRPTTPTFSLEKLDPGGTDDVRTEQIQLIEALVEDTADSAVDEKADLYHRLAELYAQRTRSYRWRATESKIKAGAAKTAKDKEQLATLAKQHAKMADDTFRKAIDTWKKVADDPRFKSYVKRDKILFAMAHTLERSGVMKDAQVAYQRLVAEYPSSPLVPRAFAAFGDRSFAATDLANAESYYAKVLAFRTSDVAPYARYRLAWVKLGRAQPEDARTTFLAAIRETAGHRNQEALHSAARRDFVRIFSELGPLDTIDARAADRSNAGAAAIATAVAERMRAGTGTIDKEIAESSEDLSSLTGEPYAVDADASFPAEFKKLALRLRENEVGIVRTAYGYHVVKRVPAP